MRGKAGDLLWHVLPAVISLVLVVHFFRVWLQLFSPLESEAWVAQRLLATGVVGVVAAGAAGVWFGLSGQVVHVAVAAFGAFTFACCCILANYAPRPSAALGVLWSGAATLISTVPINLVGRFEARRPLAGVRQLLLGGLVLCLVIYVVRTPERGGSSVTFIALVGVVWTASSNRASAAMAAVALLYSWGILVSTRDMLGTLAGLDKAGEWGAVATPRYGMDLFRKGVIRALPVLVIVQLAAGVIFFPKRPLAVVPFLYLGLSTILAASLGIAVMLGR